MRQVSQRAFFSARAQHLAGATRRHLGLRAALACTAPGRRRRLVAALWSSRQSCAARRIERATRLRAVPVRSGTDAHRVTAQRPRERPADARLMSLLLALGHAKEIVMTHGHFSVWPESTVGKL